MKRAHLGSGSEESHRVTAHVDLSPLRHRKGDGVVEGLQVNLLDTIATEKICSK